MRQEQRRMWRSSWWHCRKTETTSHVRSQSKKKYLWLFTQLCILIQLYLATSANITHVDHRYLYLFLIWKSEWSSYNSQLSSEITDKATRFFICYLLQLLVSHNHLFFSKILKVLKTKKICHSLGNNFICPLLFW